MRSRTDSARKTIAGAARAASSGRACATVVANFRRLCVQTALLAFVVGTSIPATSAQELVRSEGYEGRAVTFLTNDEPPRAAADSTANVENAKPAGGPRELANTGDEKPVEKSAPATNKNPFGEALPNGTSWWGVVGLSALSLAPALLLMTTCYVRIAVVLGLLRQSLGMSQLPPTQVLTALSLFLTALIMTPVWKDVYEQGIEPYRQSEAEVPWDVAFDRGVQPLRRFMSLQIDRAGNSEDVWLFYGYLPESRTRSTPQTYDEVPLQALLPAFLLSELKVAFLIGFQICLPFLVVDLVVSSITTSMGMMMLPTQAIALPMKLLLFVLLDGWRLVVSLLFDSFAPYS